MFTRDLGRRQGRTFLMTLDVIYHSIIRNIRKDHRSPVMSLVMNILQAVIFVGVFYLVFTILGARRAAIRGDFLLYMMSGVLPYLTHIKTLAKVAGAEGPTSDMMLHAPINTAIMFAAAAVSALYIQLLSILCILLFYHVFFAPVVIDDPVGALGMILAAWLTGAVMGVLFAAMRPWAPAFVGVVMMIYQRANMIASGKMFVANSLPASMLMLFDWNPLFHIIDQLRGFVFLNYNPHFSNPYYPFKVALALLTIGILVEYQTRRYASRSWSAGR